LSEVWDVVVVGAGAAGLFAAERSASRGLKTLLLEKNERPGVKILMSGGTRCNITHNTGARGIVEAFGRQGRFLHSALAVLPPQRVIEIVEAEGVPVKVEHTGKIFPISNRASDVLQALVDRLNRSGCELALNEPVTSVVGSPGAFQLQTSVRGIHTRNLVIACGGRSYPGSGTTGDGYSWAESMGHTIQRTRPALTPITTAAAWVPPLRGISAEDVLVEVIEPPPAEGQASGKGKGKQKKRGPLAARRQPLLFTHFGLSGPAALDVSGAISGHDSPQSLRVRCDFHPASTVGQWEEMLRAACAQAGKQPVTAVLPLDIPRRLNEALLACAEVDPAHRAAELSKAARRRVVAAVKQLEIRVEGVRGFKKAEVTAGGVTLKEVDSSTMQSKLLPGLYFAGEVLDLDGPIGGYNFQAAFSTGYLAGECVT